MTPFHSFHMRRMIPVLLLLPLMAIITACDHKDLCYHHKHMVKLRLEFDWSDCEDPERPDGMCVFFYPEQPGLETRRFDFTGLQGGEITIAAGRLPSPHLQQRHRISILPRHGIPLHPRSLHPQRWPLRICHPWQPVKQRNSTRGRNGGRRCGHLSRHDVGMFRNRHHDFRTGNQLHLRSRKGQRRVDGASAHRHRKHHHSLSS